MQLATVIDQIVLIFVFIFLLMAAYFDIKYQSIPIWLLVTELLIGAVRIVFLIIAGEMQFIDVIWAGMPGIFLLLLAFMLKDRIGYADGLMVIGIGLSSEWMICLLSIFTSFVICAFTGIVMVLLKKAKMNTRMPFAPFLLAGTGIGVCILGII